jgi:hypothetical protein
MATHLSILFVCIGSNVRVILFSTFHVCGGPILSLYFKIVMLPWWTKKHWWRKKCHINLMFTVVSTYLTTFKNSMMSGIAYPSGAPEFTPVFCSIDYIINNCLYSTYLLVFFFNYYFYKIWHKECNHVQSSIIKSMQNRKS